MAGKTLYRWTIAFWLLFGCSASLVHAVIPPLDQPQWAALTPEQKAILAPLASEWQGMDTFRRKKWLGIAQRYPAMSPAEQASVQKNMQEWARLAPEERKAAREKFKTLKKVSPEARQEVKQKWEEYNALPQEERDKLLKAAPAAPARSRAAGKPPATVPPPPAPSPSMQLRKSPLSPLKPPQSPLVPKPNRPAASQEQPS